MEEIVYLSIRLGCTAYLLYKVWEQKKRIGKICDLLCKRLGKYIL